MDPSTISCFPLPFPLLRQSWSQQRALAALLILEAEVGGSSRPHPGTRWARGGDAGGGGRAPPPSTASLGGPSNTAKSGTWGRGKETPPPWLHLQVPGLLIRKKKKNSSLPLFFLNKHEPGKKAVIILSPPAKPQESLFPLTLGHTFKSSKKPSEDCNKVC